MMNYIVLMKYNEKYLELIRFCTVGAFCTGIDTAIYYFVRLFFSYQVALVVGYIISLIINYFLTVYWTFKTESNTKNFIGIVFAHLFNLFVVRMGLMCFFVNVLLLNDRIAFVPTLIISVITNFIIIKLILSELK